MVQSSVILTLSTDIQVALDRSIRRMEQAGLQVVRSFDLMVARSAHVGCTCPHHGTQQCNCQMVVLLVYAQDGSPATLVIHGHDNQTQVALVNTPEQRPAASLVNAITRAIIPTDELGRKISNHRLGEGFHAG